MSPFYYQAAQMIGAALVLLGYVSVRRGWTTADSRSFALINLAGALVLAVVSFIGHQWGFAVLNTFWAAVSLPRRTSAPSATDRPAPS